MSPLADIQNELTVEWSRLQESWQDSNASWKDAIASKFAKRFMEPWESEMPVFLSAMAALDHELQAARRELR